MYVLAFLKLFIQLACILRPNIENTNELRYVEDPGLPPVAPCTLSLTLWEDRYFFSLRLFWNHVLIWCSGRLRSNPRSIFGAYQCIGFLKIIYLVPFIDHPWCSSVNLCSSTILGVLVAELFPTKKRNKTNIYQYTISEVKYLLYHKHFSFVALKKCLLLVD